MFKLAGNQAGGLFGLTPTSRTNTRPYAFGSGRIKAPRVSFLLRRMTCSLRRLEFRVCGARLRQRSLFDRDVYGSCRAVDVDLSRWSCGGAVHGRSCTTSRAGFLVGCGHEAEGLDIAEPAGKRVLDQARRQRCRPAPAPDP